MRKEEKRAVERRERWRPGIPRGFPACARDSQSLDAGDDGVEGGLHVGGGAGGHNGLGLFVEQLGHVLRRETGERSEPTDRVTRASSFLPSF